MFPGNISELTEMFSNSFYCSLEVYIPFGYHYISDETGETERSEAVPPGLLQPWARKA